MSSELCLFFEWRGSELQLCWSCSQGVRWPLITAKASFWFRLASSLRDRTVCLVGKSLSFRLRRPLGGEGLIGVQIELGAFCSCNRLLILSPAREHSRFGFRIVESWVSPTYTQIHGWQFAVL